MLDISRGGNKNEADKLGDADVHRRLSLRLRLCVGKPELKAHSIGALCLVCKSVPGNWSRIPPVTDTPGF
ncbi:MAG: hypothetical protein WC794_04005 [Candidatus Doudnabacteria bacterium]